MPGPCHPATFQAGVNNMCILMHCSGRLQHKNYQSDTNHNIKYLNLRAFNPMPV